MGHILPHIQQRLADLAHMKSFSRARRLTLVVFVALTMIVSTAAPASAQYGGITGLFVSSSIDTPKQADFSGLGCASGSEVVLYFPGLQPTSGDPVASQSVPGRIVGVTTALTDANSLIDGSFSFPGVRFPANLDPGSYQVNSRCGSLDLSVTVRLTVNCEITPISPPVGSVPPGLTFVPDGNGGGVFLPFTGRESSRIFSLAAGLLAAGVAALSLSRRERTLS